MSEAHQPVKQVRKRWNGAKEQADHDEERGQEL
jgi:hypothetical protein